MAHPGIAGVEAAISAWSDGDEWLTAVLAYLRGNRKALREQLRSKAPQLRSVHPDATYLAWLDCRPLGLGRDTSRFFLKTAKVALHDGRNFGELGVGFVRLNFATSRQLLTEIIGRMSQAIAGL